MYKYALHNTVAFLLLILIQMISVSTLYARGKGPIGLYNIDDSHFLVADSEVDSVYSVSLSDPFFLDSAVMVEMGAKADPKSVATCKGCDFVLFTGQSNKQTQLYVFRKVDPTPHLLISRAGLKFVLIGDEGETIYITNKDQNRIEKLKFDQERLKIISTEVLLNIDSPLKLAFSSDNTNIFVARKTHVTLIALMGKIIHNWELSKPCGFDRFKVKTIRSVQPDFRKSAFYIIINSALFEVELNNDDMSEVQSCRLIAGKIKEKGFIDACGKDARFARPHDMVRLENEPAIILTDTDNSFLRRVELASGANFGCVTSIPLYSEVKERSDKTCAELDWNTNPSTKAGYSYCADDPLALTDRDEVNTEAEASDYCKELGARLCTAAELGALPISPLPTQMDQPYVWTSTACRGHSYGGKKDWYGGYIQQLMKSDQNISAVCRKKKKAGVRCCADSLQK